MHTTIWRDVVNMTKTAFITGIAGQDGAYLTRFLLDKGYRVHGLVRWDSYADPLEGVARLDALGLVGDDVTLHMGDVTDANNLNSVLQKVQPDEVYNLAGLSQVQVSFETPGSTFDINAGGTRNLLEGLRVLGMDNRVRVYQASSSEMFGAVQAPQNEETIMQPCSPYGIAKLAAYHYARMCRDSYGMFVCNGILFNHESPLRGEDFVTRKITKAVAEFEAGRTEPLSLGNLDSQRDWGDARDYVEGMWLMLQQEQADDYVLATEETHSVRRFVERAFAQIGVSLKWQGHGRDEQGLDSKTGKVLVAVDPVLFRPAEIHVLRGNAAKARKALRWAPKVSFDELVSTMVNTDRALLKQDKVSWPKAG